MYFPLEIFALCIIPTQHVYLIVINNTKNNNRECKVEHESSKSEWLILFYYIQVLMLKFRGILKSFIQEKSKIFVLIC